MIVLILTAEHLKPYTVKAKLELGIGTYGQVLLAGEMVAGKVFETLANIDRQIVWRT